MLLPGLGKLHPEEISRNFQASLYLGIFNNKKRFARSDDASIRKFNHKYIIIYVRNPL